VSYPPEEIHRGDQHYAEVESGLDRYVDAYRTRYEGVGRIEALDDLASLLGCPHLADGTDIGREGHVGTLANLLTVAIDRLARQ
jgi:hypothetical protein